jgi:hypothetical protein
MSSSELEKNARNGASADAADEAELARMGYKQELKRDLSMVQVRGVTP